jgi:hypothetical protein
LRENQNVPPRLLLLLATAASLFAADWTEYRSGPYRVVSNAGDKAARERLNEMEQVRQALGAMLGKQEMQSVWPVTLILFDNAKQYGPNAVPKPFVDGGSAILSAWSADTPLPLDWKHELARNLIEDNAGRMPESIETALGDLCSTLQVTGTRITLGAPLPQGMLTGDRLRAWSRMQYLATNVELAARLRIYLNNLQQGGDEPLALKNAYNLTVEEVDQRVAEYAKAAKFETTSLPGRAINPSRDFVEKPVSASAITALLAELKAAGSGNITYDPDSPRGLVAKNTKPSLELAATANPRWAEPHVKLAALETNPLAKVKELKTAAALEPRSVAIWQALAGAQTAANQQTDAARSWASAMRAAPNDAERERLRKIQREAEERRIEFEIAEKRRAASERAQELENLKQQAAAEIHAAEEAANKAQGGLKSDAKPVEWWNDPKGEPVEGKLTRVDCLKGPLKLTVEKSAGAQTVVLIPDPNKLTVRGAGEASFACGLQRPARSIKLEHDAKPDAKMGTAGNVLVVEFP